MQFSLSPHITETLMRLADNPSPELDIALRMAGQGLEEGHVCLNLRELASGNRTSPEGRQLPVPDLQQWRTSLKNSGVVGRPGEYAPLILDSDLLYFHRYYEYERQVADFIRGRRGRYTAGLDLEKLKTGLDRLFPNRGRDNCRVDWQKVSAFLAMTGRFTVISGGPGTGKTTTVARILALMLEQNPVLNILLGAPTGKAAARLQDSLAKARETLPVDSKILESFPDKSSTIHRLLGKARGRLKFDRGKRLSADIVIIDEASMVDLPLMAQLMVAVPEHCSLVLLGDRYQLASVQPGAVFADICQGNTRSFTRECSLLARDCRAGDLPADSGDSRSDSLVELQANYRFAENSGIGLLSRMVKQGERDKASALLVSHDQPEVSWYDLDLFSADQAGQKIVSRTIGQFRRIMAASGPEEALAEMGKTVILCGLRRGPFGAVNLNRLLEKAIGPAGLQKFYHGRPVMILENDYKRELYNGDTGIVCPDPQRGGEIRCFFPDRPEGISPGRLPEHETAYAMTVHKSQGSEYDHIILILSDTIAPVFVRELLYTGITRARHSVEIWSSSRVWRDTIEKRISRSSGLADRLNRRGASDLFENKKQIF